MTTPLLRPHGFATFTLDEPVIIEPGVRLLTTQFNSWPSGWLDYNNPLNYMAYGGLSDSNSAAWDRASLGAGVVKVGTLSGLVIGRSYTLKLQVRVPTGSPQFWMRAAATDSTHTAATTSFVQRTLTFIATATSEDLQFGCNSAGQFFVDDMTLDLNPVLDTSADLTVSEGRVALDAMGVPYGSATVTVPLTTLDLIEEIDPRNEQRVTLTGAEQISGESRVFDLALRRRTVNHKDRSMELELATDEALLQDYAPLTDVDLWDHRTSLRSVVNQVLATCIPGAVLESSPSPDADITPRWEQTNLILNPRGATDTTDWAASLSGGVAGTLVRTTSSSVQEGASLGSYLRLNVTTTGTGNALLRYGSATTPAVNASKMFTASAWVHQASGSAKNSRLILRFVNAAGTLVKDYSVDLPTHPSGTWQKLSVTGLAPVNAVRALIYVGVSNGMPSGTFVGVSAVVLAEGTRNDIWFDGSRADDSTYTYDWTPDALTTPSVRVPVGGTIEPDSLLWPAGVTAWEFLQPLTAGAGLRLFCDEYRKWRLIDPEVYYAPGRVSISPMNTTEGTDEISLADAEVYCTGVVVRYSWTDAQGVERTRSDTAGLPGRVLVIELQRPWPGAGVAAAVLTRRTGQGRLQEATALARWGSTPSQQISISLPGTLDQLGQLEAVEWGLTNGLMRVKTRALTDIIPGSINALTGTINALTGTINAL